MNQLLKRLSEDLKLKGYAPKSILAYLREIRKLFNFYDRVGLEISEEEIRRYFLHQVETKKVSESLFRQSLAGIRFLYQTTLGRQWKIFSLVRPKRIYKLPSVLSKDEVKLLLEKTGFLKYRAIFTLIYSAGLRVSELCSLKLTDIDSKRMLLKVNQSKGNLDRYVILGKKTLEILREYYLAFKPVGYLFNGNKKNAPVSIRSIQHGFSLVLKKTGIKKKVSLHSLRHSFATHLMEDGVHLRNIQTLMGHRNIQSTMIYTHVSQQKLSLVKNPIDTF